MSNGPYWVTRNDSWFGMIHTYHGTGDAPRCQVWENASGFWGAHHSATELLGPFKNLKEAKEAVYARYKEVDDRMKRTRKQRKERKLAEEFSV